MISSAVVKRKEIIGKEQRQNHQEMRKDGPKIIVVAPPKVQLNRVYVIPEDRNLPIIQPRLEYNYPVAPTKQVKLRSNTEKVEPAIINSPRITQKWEPTANMEIRVPTRIFPIDKSHMRRENIENSNFSQKKQEQKEANRKVNIFVSEKWLSNAASQFQFTRKSKKHIMPKDSTHELTIVSIALIKPFNI